MPTSVRPWRSIIGSAAASSSRVVSRIVSVWAVGRGSVCERVAREKSSKRSRSTTVRPTRPAVLIRRVTRSTRPIATASISAGDFGERPSARCEPIEPRRRPGCDGPRVAVVGERVQVAARRAAEHRLERLLGDAARAGRRCVIPRARSFSAVTGPTPQSRSTGKRVEEGELAVRRRRAAVRRASRRRSRPSRGTSSGRRRP